MARPPRGPLGRSDRRVLAVFGGVAVLTVLAVLYGVFVVAPDDDEAPPTPTAAPAATVPVAAPATPVTPTAPPSPATRVDCAGACLVRVAETDGTRAQLAGLGIAPAYAFGGQVWAAAPPAAIATLRADGLEVAEVSPDTDTLGLYVVRLPDGAGAEAEALVAGFGEALDRAGNQVIVRVPEVPAYVAPLVGAGIWVEKFPPAPEPRPAALRREPVAGRALVDLGAAAAEIDGDGLWATVGDLQGMSSTDGTGVGTRHYGTPGNVMAAEYLYRTLAGYGLEVWYEDFVTGDGLLALNVVGELPGADPSAVYVVMGHYDSKNDGGDQANAPGADDNATGVAAMLEIARVLAGYDLAHPVRFFATNVEEEGLQGVKAFAARAAEAGTPIVGAYNLDAIGSPMHGTQLVLNGDAASAWLQDLLIEVNDAYGFGQALVVRQNPGIVADDNFMRDYGFPTILVARELFGWSSIHHTPADVRDAVDLGNVVACAQLVLVALGTLVGEG